jgi:hypothetical protein
MQPLETMPVFWAKMLYNYVRRTLPDAGAQQYAFIPAFMNPLFSLPGPGTPYSFRWNPLQPEQLYYNLAQNMQGVLGVVAGQMALQPLLDTRNGVGGANG